MEGWAMNRFVGIIGILVGAIYFLNSFQADDNQDLFESAEEAKEMMINFDVDNPQINADTLKKFSESVEALNTSEDRKANALRITSAMLIIVSLILVLKGKVTAKQP